jgi:hypothetical protein
MTTTTKDVFEIKGWDENTWDGRPQKEVEGAKQTYAIVKQRFHGVIEGDSEAHEVMTYNTEGFAHYVGLQVVSGQVGGKSGSFVMESRGSYDPKTGIAEMNLTVIPGSGTGDLKGLRGKGHYAVGHGDLLPYTFDFSFE